VNQASSNPRVVMQPGPGVTIRPRPDEAGSDVDTGNPVERVDRVVHGRTLVSPCATRERPWG